MSKRRQQEGREEHDPEREALHAWTLAVKGRVLLQLDITHVPVHAAFQPRRASATVSSVPLPLLLLDIDGVCFPFDAGEGAPTDLERVSAGGSGVLLSQATAPLLRELGSLFELCWASGWEHEANLRVCPLLGLPPLPVIVFAD